MKNILLKNIFLSSLSFLCGPVFSTDMTVPPWMWPSSKIPESPLVYVEPCENFLGSVLNSVKNKKARQEAIEARNVRC
jgi:hypothetical protein